MSVHTLGNTTAPSFGANDTTENEVAPTLFVTQPTDGYITALHAYVYATTGTISLQLLLVGSGGSLNIITSAQTVGTSAGWQSASITPYFIGAGNNQATAFFIGSGEMHFPVYNGGNFKIGNPGSPSGTSGFSLGGGAFFAGNIGSYYEWIDPLRVSGVSPSVAGPGQTVTVSGGGFVGGSITSITFNGVAASSWTVNSDSSLTVTVPAGATSGALTVNSDHGSGSVGFTVSAMRVYDGSAWQPCQVYAYDGATWQVCQVYIFDGTSWQPSD